MGKRTPSEGGSKVPGSIALRFPRDVIATSKLLYAPPARAAARASPPRADR